MTALPPFQELLDRHAADVHGFRCWRRSGRADADDCFQETFIAALRAYPRLRDGSNLRGWLLTIAQRKAIDHHRAAQRSTTGAALPRWPRSPSATPSADAGIWHAVAALPPKQRTAVALRYACDLPHREIAAAIGCSEEAARRSVHEGIKRLRKELA